MAAFKQCQIETIAMESIGVYWIPLFQMLERNAARRRAAAARLAQRKTPAVGQLGYGSGLAVKPPASMFQAYRHWCNENGIRYPLTSRLLARKLREEAGKTAEPANPSVFGAASNQRIHDQPPPGRMRSGQPDPLAARGAARAAGQ
jgi:hypothetical protein